MFPLAGGGPNLASSYDMNLYLEADGTLEIKFYSGKSPQYVGQCAGCFLFRVI